MNIDWNRRGYTEEEFIKQWYLADNFDILARNLGYSYYHTTKSKFKEMGESLGLTRDHMDNSKRLPQGRQSVEQHLVYHSDREIRSSTLKRLLFKHRYFEEKCYGENCQWNSKEISPPLELDHINGDNRDNRLENLRILCRNCHGLTDTFARAKNTKEKNKPNKVALCIFCNKPCRYDAYWHTRCSECAHDGCSQKITDRAVYCRSHEKQYRRSLPPKKKIDITYEELISLLDSGLTYREIADTLGCTENGLRLKVRRRKAKEETLDNMSGID